MFSVISKSFNFVKLLYILYYNYR